MKRPVIIILFFLTFLLLSCKKEAIVRTVVVNHVTRERIPVAGIVFHIEETRNIKTRNQTKMITSIMTDDNGEFILNFKGKENRNNDKYLMKMDHQSYTDDALKRLDDTITEVLPLYSVRDFEQEWSIFPGESQTIEISAVPLTRIKVIANWVAPNGSELVSYSCRNGYLNNEDYQTGGLYTIGWPNPFGALGAFGVYRRIRTYGTLVFQWTVKKSGKQIDFYDSITVNPALKNTYRINY